MLRFLPFVLLLSAANAAANDVTVTVKGGALAIKGDDDANAITLDQAGLGAGSVRVTPSGGTTVNGSGTAQVFDGLVSGAKIGLGKGSDRLQTLGVTLHGAVKLDLGAGDNAFTFCDTTFDDDVVVKIGKHTGGPVSDTCPGAGNVSTVGGSVFLIHNADFGGALTVKASSAVHVGVVDDVAVSGPLAFKNVALVGACYSTLSSSVAVKLPKIVGSAGGDVSCEGGATEAFANGNTAFAMSGTTVGAALAIKSGAGGDGIVVTGSSVQDSMSVAMSGGLNFLFLEGVQVGTEFTAKAGKDDDDFFGDGLLIGDDATVKYAGGANVIDFGTSTIGEDLTVGTGGGNDAITTGNVTVGGTKTIKSGKGADTIS